MARVESTLNPNQFTIGWICALPVEKALATLMLDEDFGPRQIQFGPESHLYRLGCIGSHYVVIACILEAYGIAEANNTAVHLLRDFPSVKIGLLVGIGGGIPCHKDVRLGDVIVSQPDGGTHGGVVHYDFGKKLPGGRFERKGHLDKPPQALRTAVAAIADDHRLSGSQFEAYLNTTLRQRAENEQYSELLKNLERPQQDNLFHADYQHQSRGRRCDQCAKSGQVERDARPNTEPRIHYGTIASGSQVVKDAKTRDRLAKDDENILCIETEAAGLMNHFRCVVVRGVSDYADSHKNDDWHYYAAAIAAIYAKHLLFKVIAAEVDQEMSIAEVIYVSTSRQSSAPQRPYSPNYSALRLAQQSEEPGRMITSQMSSSYPESQNLTPPYRRPGQNSNQQKPRPPHPDLNPSYPNSSQPTHGTPSYPPGNTHKVPPALKPGSTSGYKPPPQMDYTPYPPHRPPPPTDQWWNKPPSSTAVPTGHYHPTGSTSHPPTSGYPGPPDLSTNNSHPNHHSDQPHPTGVPPNPGSNHSNPHWGHWDEPDWQVNNNSNDQNQWNNPGPSNHSDGWNNPDRPNPNYNNHYSNPNHNPSISPPHNHHSNNSNHSIHHSDSSPPLPPPKPEEGTEDPNHPSTPNPEHDHSNDDTSSENKVGTEEGNAEDEYEDDNENWCGECFGCCGDSNDTEQDKHGDEEEDKDKDSGYCIIM